MSRSKSQRTDGKDKGKDHRTKLSPSMDWNEAFEEMFPVKNEWLDKYMELIRYARSEEYEPHSYTEKHHIIPRSFYEKKHMSIDNSDTNLVALNLQDHFMAHWYMSMCCSKKMKRSMDYAVMLMSNMVNCKTNREDCAISKSVAFAMSKVDKMRIPMSEEQRAKIREAWKSGEVKQKMMESLMTEENLEKFREQARRVSIFNTGKKHSQEWKDNISNSWTDERKAEWGRKVSERNTGKPHPHKGGFQSEEKRRKISEARKGAKNPSFGKHPSEETRKKMSEARKAYWAKRKTEEQQLNIT